MRITTAGVGIGTSSPSYLLHAYQNTGVQYSQLDAMFENASADSKVGLAMKNDAQTWKYFLNGADGDKWMIEDTTNSKWPFKISTNSPTDSVVITSTGVGMGLSSPAYQLDIRRALTGNGFTGLNVGVDAGTASAKVGVVQNVGANYAGVWMAQASPSTTNYSFLYANGSLFNTPLNTTMAFRVNNTTKLSLSGTTFTKNVTMQSEDGSISSPAYSFTSETNSGIYRLGLGTIGVVTQGNVGTQFNSSGVSAMKFSTAGEFEASNPYDYIYTSLKSEPYSSGGGLYGAGNLYLVSNRNSDGGWADINITANSTNFGSGNGGSVNITSGVENDSNFTSSYVSGNISITAGDATYGFGGGIALQGSNAHDYSNFGTIAGGISVTGGNYYGYSSGMAGAVTIQGGNANNSGTGGVVTLQGGYDFNLSNYSRVNINPYGGNVFIGGNVVDNGNYISIDSISRALYDSTGSYAMLRWDFADGLYGGSSPSGLLDLTNGKLKTYITSYVADSLDFYNRYLIGGDGINITLDWNNCFAQDPGGLESFDWGSRNLSDSSEAPSLDWQNRQLLDTASNVAIDWSGGAPKFQDPSYVTSPVEGMIAYDYANHYPVYYDGSNWVQM
jgi:hypothetical protein